MISNQNFYILHHYDPAVSSYPFAFGAASETDILVYDINPSLDQADPGYQTAVTAFSVIPAEGGIVNGGAAVLSVQLTAGHKVLIQRATPLTQNIQFPKQQRIYPPALEEGLDRLTMIAQEHDGRLDGVDIDVSEIRKDIEDVDQKVDDAIEAMSNLRHSDLKGLNDPDQHLTSAITHTNGQHLDMVITNQANQITIANQNLAAEKTDRQEADANLQAQINQRVNTTDPRLSDARTPLAHAITHKTGGTDPLTPGDIGALGPDHLTASNPHPQYALASYVNLMRKPCITNTTINVSKTGSDSNDGINAPISTLNRLTAVCRGLIGAGVNLTINIGAGEWNETLTFEGNCFIGFRYVVVQGAGMDKTLIALDGNTTATLLAFLYPNVSNGIVVSGMRFSGASNHIRAFGSGYVNIQNVDFGPANNVHMVLERAAQVFAWSVPYTISGSAARHIHMSQMSQFMAPGVNMTLLNTPNFAGQFIYAGEQSFARFDGATFAGNATGQRHYIDSGSYLRVDGAGEEFLPGNRAGTVVTARGALLA